MNGQKRLKYLEIVDADLETRNLSLGDNVVTFPPLTDPSGTKEGSFSIFLHPWFDYAEIDESKSYIEAVASN